MTRIYLVLHPVPHRRLFVIDHPSIDFEVRVWNLEFEKVYQLSQRNLYWGDRTDPHFTG